ncbi:MAG TPA: fluoride efflux transporter CrcB [Haliangiales bacterium]|nr:fluoride efflux transporter CrcB [Haliangiales bacterium]
MLRLLLVCAAGAVGTGLRYLISLATPRLLGAAFPWATLLINVAGSFVLAAVMFLGSQTTAISPTARVALGTGLCGGFTTYSTFNYETMKLIEDRAFGLAAANVAGTLLACLAAGYLGWAAARLAFAH